MSATQVEYFPLGGGEDLVSPTFSIPPGRVLFSQNYEQGVVGGYIKSQGYERFDGQPSPSGGADANEIATRRAAINAVPGSGPIRGVWMFNGDVYAFRDNAAATECNMYKATPSGWTLVSTPTLLPGGRFEFVNYNFRGSASSIRMYGCDGVNKAFEFDGTTMTQITTGMTTDTPKHIAAFKKHLFLIFPNGSVQHSSIGDPLTWSPVTGASEIAVGDEGTGLKPLPGGVLAIFTRNHTYALYGSSSADWQLQLISEEGGAYEWTQQSIAGDTFFLDDRGVTNLKATQAFGDFSHSTISIPISPLIDTLRPNINASMVVKNKSQYRLFAGKNVLVATFSSTKLVGWTRMYLDHNVTCCFSGEDANGKEKLFFGSDNGFVYQMDIGTSFDGNPINSYLRLPFNHSRSPRHRKRYRKAVLELDLQGATTLQYQAEYDYGSFEVAKPDAQSLALSGGGGYWNISTWNTFNWTEPIISVAEASLTGSGVNIGLIIYSSSSTELPHRIDGVVLHYDVRRIKR